ncbi:Saposin-like type B, 1 domain and Saposin B domain and Saposin-like domain-containing protein [Aphelenchoides bicaudatus]|nr:Saposin-like type B, 1 domain and Saposin B domain and Saposin-like domain-containing protein [Aphelenchoides bicaudatus]
MKSLLVLAALFAIAVAHINDDKTEMVNENRVPKMPTFGSVCTECESLVKRIVEVADDPTKLAELKILLSALCHETSYEDECKVFVSKLDLFIKELLPYLKDPHTVCKDIHLCSNKKIEAFHRIGLLYAKQYVNKLDGANDLICEECQFAAHELQESIDKREIQADVRRFLSTNVCKHLGSYQGSCDVLLDDFLPEFFQELHNLLAQPREFCEHIKLCQPTIASLLHKNKMDHEEKLKRGAFKEFMQKISSVPFSVDPKLATASCVECRIAVDTLLLHLADDTTSKQLGDDLRDTVCPILPSNMFDGCQDFVNMYGQSAVKMAVGQVTADEVCTAIHACDKKSFAKAISLHKLKMYSCPACKETAKLAEGELQSREMRKRLIHEAKHFACDWLPGSFKLPCNKLASNYVPFVMSRLMQSLQKQQICQAVKAC